MFTTLRVIALVFGAAAVGLVIIHIAWLAAVLCFAAIIFWDQAKKLKQRRTATILPLEELSQQK